MDDLYVAVSSQNEPTKIVHETHKIPAIANTFVIERELFHKIKLDDKNKSA